MGGAITSHERENMAEVDILKKHGFVFKKQYGQNFLSDANLLDAIVRDADMGGGKTVLEIGAGAGALTRALAKQAGRVVAYEIDKSLQGVLSEALSGCDNVEVVFRDFMKENLVALERELGEYVVVANLPYYVTTPVVMRLLEEATSCRGITVMVQEEVAERFCAEAGTAEYSAITAAIALFGSCRITRRVPRSMFTPRPNVDSAVVKITFEEGRIPVISRRAYREVVRVAFLNRRKTLENNLIGAFKLTRPQAKEILQAAEVPENARGETLPPEHFARLADLLTERGICK